MRFIIKGHDDNAEIIEESFEIPFHIYHPTAEKDGLIFLYAIRQLWESRWTPGSVSWRVYGLNLNNEPFAMPIGENY